MENKRFHPQGIVRVRERGMTFERDFRMKQRILWGEGRCLFTVQVASLYQVESTVIVGLL